MTGRSQGPCRPSLAVVLQQRQREGIWKIDARAPRRAALCFLTMFVAIFASVCSLSKRIIGRGASTARLSAGAPPI